MKYLFCLAILLTGLAGTTQPTDSDWEAMMGDPSVSFYTIRQAYNAYWQDKPVPRGAGHKPYKRWEYLMETRVDKNGYYNPLERQEAYYSYFNRHNRYKSVSNPWIPIGPDVQPSGNNGIGRINVVAVHPDDSNKIFAGTPAGGLWMSTDGGSSWSTVTDTLTNLGVSDIVFHPLHPDTIYIATGDRDHNDTATFGILKSTDGGNSWAATDFQPSQNGLPAFYLIHRLLINPNDGDIMIASTTNGVFRTTDGWSSWTQVLPNDCLRHMQFKPGDPDIIYGTTSGSYCGGLNPVATYFRSTDNGASWTEITLPHTNDLQRIGIGVTDANPSLLYMLAAYNDPASNNDFFALYKSSDSGLTISEVAVNAAPDLGSQQWYDWSFTVSPVDEDMLFAGGVGFCKSTDGGVNWIPSGSGVHVDHHFAKYFGNDLYVGSDGGIWRSSSDGASWTNLNDGLVIGQYYRISTAETDPTIMLAGSQDNGTHKLSSGSWNHEFGGDGMDNAIDPLDEDNMFVSYQYGHFFRSTNGGTTYSPMIDDNLTGVNGAWVTPIKLNPINPDTMYTGYDRVWKSTNGGASWYDPYGTSLTGTTQIQYIDVADSNPDYIYVTDYSKIWKSTDGGVSWALTTDPGSSIRWIETDPTDENHLWICTGHKIMESGDGGNSWTDISGSLPNIDMNTIVYDQGSNEGLYVGSDIGVFYKDDSMSDWVPFGSDLPNVIVLELDINENEGKIKAATFGRGIWQANLNSITCSIDSLSDIGITSCDDGTATYSRDLEVSYSGHPLTGDLEVMGQVFSITSSPQIVSLTGLPVDGQSQDVTAEFTADTSCYITMTNLFANPATCPCLITDSQYQVISCDDQGTTDSSDDRYIFSIDPTGTNTSSTYSVSGDINAAGISYGAPHIFDNGGPGYLISDGDMTIHITDDNEAACTLDNELLQAPDPCSSNFTCGDAFALTTDGMYTAIGPNQGNGGSQPGRHANWFYFVAPSDGVITVQSCEGGVDTRLFIHEGNCGSLVQLSTNDDYCEMASGSALYASYLQQCVTSGLTYYIEWDDRWSSLGFDFHFDFDSGVPATPTIDSYPYTESFETLTDTWVMSCEDDMNWTKNSGSTPSGNTGPGSAYDGSQYLYTEATENFNNVAYHIGPKLDFNTNNGPEISFYYHMYGGDMGSLSLELSTDDGASWSTVWSKTGNQGNEWHLVTINLYAYAGMTIQMRFKGVVGPAYQSDMAIDYITVIDSNPNDCIPLETVDDNPIPDSTFSAMVISSSGVVPANGTVIFEALNEVQLHQGFSVEPGAIFELTIGDCNSNPFSQASENK